MHPLSDSDDEDDDDDESDEEDDCCRGVFGIGKAGVGDGTRQRVRRTPEPRLVFGPVSYTHLTLPTILLV